MKLEGGRVKKCSKNLQISKCLGFEVCATSLVPALNEKLKKTYILLSIFNFQSSDPESGDFQAEQKMRPTKKLFQKKERHKSDLDSVVLKEKGENCGVQVNSAVA